MSTPASPLGIIHSAQLATTAEKATSSASGSFIFLRRFSQPVKNINAVSVNSPRGLFTLSTCADAFAESSSAVSAPTSELKIALKYRALL